MTDFHFQYVIDASENIQKEILSSWIYNSIVFSNTYHWKASSVKANNSTIGAWLLSEEVGAEDLRLHFLRLFYFE